ncbi:MAG: sporulation protein YqfD [Ruminococcus sp.]|nr:sporulation protein YqfD [Ruminococcus sp.]
MKDQLRGCVKISAKGNDLYRFINMIHSGRVCCFGQFCRKEVFYGEVYRRDLPKIEAMADECGVELSSAEMRTLSSILRKYRRRVGLLLGAFLAVFTVAYFSSVVVTIEVQGNSAVSEDKIIAALDELGIRKGANIRDIDLNYCSNELRVRVPGISWAGIRHTGNRIVVEVTEVVPPPEKPEKRVACNIVSTKRAKITTFKVLDGFLMHKIGDYVTEGSLLVSGISTSDNTGKIVLHHAIASVTGIYDETAVFSGSFEPVRTVYTGRKLNRKSVKLFGIRIPLYLRKNKFRSSETDRSFEPLVLFGRELPVGVVREEIRETELAGVSYTPEELEAELNRKIFFYEKNFISEDTKIISRNIERTETADGITLTVKYTLEGEIGREKPLLVK